VRRAILATCLLVAACSGDLARGESLFQKGRYPEAERAFVRIEARERDADDRERATYALYRALTHGALGDLAARDYWLREAVAIERAHPGALEERDRERLRIAIDQSAWDRGDLYRGDR
jgi:hypothetical protein